MIPDTHLRMYPEPADEPISLFLDEIQLVPGWETFIRRLLDTPGHEVFLSGSSAKLLSREIATSMRGRAWEITIHPFSFSEFLRHHGHEIPADPALIPVFDRSGKPNTSHALESVVFTELQRRRAEVAYVKTTGGFEVDFLARYPDGSEDLIQVCASVDDPDTLSREVRSLEDAITEHPRARQLILTMESRVPFPAVPEPIRIVPAWEWMLSPQLASAP